MWSLFPLSLHTQRKDYVNVVAAAASEMKRVPGLHGSINVETLMEALQEVSPP